MKPLKISDLRTRIEFQSVTKSQNSRGGYDSLWDEDFKSWSRLLSISDSGGMRYQLGDQLSQDSTHYCTIRYNKKVNTDQRIIYGGDHYTINSIVRMTAGRQEYSVLGCTWEGSIR